MKRMKIAIFVLIVLAIVLASCTTAKFSGLQVSKELKAYKTVGEFNVSVPVIELLGSAGGANLFNITADAMNAKVSDAIQAEIGKLSGDAAIDITIEQKNAFFDILLNGLTGAILAPTHVIITGTVIKYND